MGDFSDIFKPGDKFVLHFPGKVHKMGADPPHADHQVPVLLRVQPGVFQILCIDHIGLVLAAA